MPVQAHEGRELERAGFTPIALVADLPYSQWRKCSEKVLTIVGADRFTRRGGFCRLHAMFMNQSFMTWGLREELSSRSLFRVP